MPSNSERKYQRVVSFIEDQVGADVNRDMLKVALSDQDISVVTVNTPDDKELRSRLFGIGPNNNVNSVSVLELSDTLQNTSGVQATYLARALASKDLDEFISRVTDSNGNQINPMTTEPLASVGNDEVRVVSPDPLDVSASEVDVDISSQTQNPLTVTDDGSLAIAAWNAGTIQVNETDKGAVTDQSSSAGSGSAAQLDLGDNRKDVDIFYDTSGASTITIEVSKDGSNWRQFDTENPQSAENDIIQMDTAYRHIRVYADQNINMIEISSKGE